MEKDDEILLQIFAVGNAVKVVAVHAATGTEVSFAAPKNTPAPALKTLARAKLEYVLKKNG